ADLPEMLRRWTAKPWWIDIGEGQPGIVDEDIDAAEPGARFSDDAAAFVRLAQIGNQRLEPIAQLKLRRFRRDLWHIAVDMADRDDGMTLPSEPEGHRPPQPTQATGDNR